LKTKLSILALAVFALMLLGLMAQSTNAQTAQANNSDTATQVQVGVWLVSVEKVDLPASS
jgi:hypothetical protein